MDGCVWEWGIPFVHDWDQPSWSCCLFAQENQQEVGMAQILRPGGPWNSQIDCPSLVRFPPKCFGAKIWTMSKWPCGFLNSEVNLHYSMFSKQRKPGTQRYFAHVNFELNNFGKANCSSCEPLKFKEPAAQPIVDLQCRSRHFQSRGCCQSCW